MTFISRNVALGSPLRLSAWRKIAIGTWRGAGDPSVYGAMDFDAAPGLAYIEKLRRETGLRITLTHFVGKAIAETIARNPEINCILRFGRLYPRRAVDVFFQVATDAHGNDLSGMVLRHADRKSVAEIAQEMETRVQTIRKQGDPDFRRMKGMVGMLPGFLARLAVNVPGFIMYGLNIWTRLFGIPHDPFGSVMITNIGSLGLDMAYAPLVPYSRVPLLIALGAVRDTPLARDGKVVVAPVARMCVTFDHRVIDGVHASRMARTLATILANPERELRVPELPR